MQATKQSLADRAASAPGRREFDEVETPARRARAARARVEDFARRLVD